MAAVRARARAARWRALPTLDLVGSLGGNGLSGTGRDVLFPGATEPVRTDIDGGFGESWAQVRDRDFPTWSLGLVFASWQYQDARKLANELPHSSDEE